MTDAENWQSLDAFPFGDTPELADELLALILAGSKTATCWNAVHGIRGTEVGKCWVVLDGAGAPRAVLRTTEVTQRRFNEMDADFAATEGEGDLSLAYWRRAHQDFFTRESHFAPDMLLYCERFELVRVLEDDK